MKNILIPGFALLLGAMAGCAKEDGCFNRGSMKVVIDCSGVYLRHANKIDYKVCNVDKVKDYKDGEMVDVSFNKLPSCKSEDDKITCKLYHKYESYVEVVAIR